jgi:hypothetical protein|tara:strand:+ start:1123 stop:1404 length:282 start_codon:yes stop_codon:yes gene_type:complete
VDQWVGIAERFGLPVVMLLGMTYGMVQLFKWMANDLMRQLQNNADRIEKIVVTLIDNSKKEREQNREHFNSIFQRLDSLVDVLVKLSGNGLKK